MSDDKWRSRFALLSIVSIISSISGSLVFPCIISARPSIGWIGVLNSWAATLMNSFWIFSLRSSCMLIAIIFSLARASCLLDSSSWLFTLMSLALDSLISLVFASTSLLSPVFHLASKKMRTAIDTVVPARTVKLSVLWADNMPSISAYTTEVGVMTNTK